MPETVPRLDVPARGVHVIPGDVPEGVVPPSTSLTPPTTPHPIPDATHPYVHLSYGPWVASGHQCGDVKPGGCGEPIYERRVTARWDGVGEERFIGWDLAGCPSCAPRPDVPDEPQDVVTALVDKARELGVRIGGYEATVLAARVVAVARPEIERQVRERVAAESAVLDPKDLAELLNYVIGREGIRVVQEETLDRAFAALKATQRGES